MNIIIIIIIKQNTAEKKYSCIKERAETRDKKDKKGMKKNEEKYCDKVYDERRDKF